MGKSSGGSPPDPRLVAQFIGDQQSKSADNVSKNTVPLGSLPPQLANLASNATDLQRGSPQLPWYAVPNMFGPNGLKDTRMADLHPVVAAALNSPSPNIFVLGSAPGGSEGGGGGGAQGGGPGGAAGADFGGGGSGGPGGGSAGGQGGASADTNSGGGEPH